MRRAQAQRDYNQLVAPADGIVLRRDGEPGQFVAAGQTVLTLACCAPLRVSAEVDEEDIPRVVVGQKVMLRTDALPGRLFDGEVAEITPKGDPVSRSYRVRIRLADAPAVDAGPLRTGMTMDANLIVVAPRERVARAQPRAEGQRGVGVEQGRVQRREVKKGVTGAERSRDRLAGSREGETVVLRPPTRCARASAPTACRPRRRHPPHRRGADAMAIALDVALAHLTSRKRQTLVSLTGVVLGVAFFLAVSSLMRGSEKDFMKRLVDNSPHITVYDEVRQGRAQPAELRWPDARGQRAAT